MVYKIAVENEIFQCKMMNKMVHHEQNLNKRMKKNAFYTFNDLKTANIVFRNFKQANG